MKAGLSDIVIEYVGFLPLRYINIPGVAMLNRIVNKTPFLQLFSSFIYIKGKKGKVMKVFPSKTKNLVYFIYRLIRPILDPVNSIMVRPDILDLYGI